MVHDPHGLHRLTAGTTPAPPATRSSSFFEREPTGPSVGSGVDHIGFSFPDLAAKMDSFEGRPASGSSSPCGRSRACSSWRSSRTRGAPRSRWSRTPSGSASTTSTSGRPTPAAALDWYEHIFDGERDSLKGRIAGLRYGTVWLLISRGPTARAGPDRGPGVRSPGLAVPRPAGRRRGDSRRRASTSRWSRAPFTNPLGEDMLISFVVGPDGVRIERSVQPQRVAPRRAGARFHFNAVGTASIRGPDRRRSIPSTPAPARARSCSTRHWRRFRPTISNPSFAPRRCRGHGHGHPAGHFQHYNRCHASLLRTSGEDRGEEWPRVRAHPSVDQLPRRHPGGITSSLDAAGSGGGAVRTESPAPRCRPGPRKRCGRSIWSRECRRPRAIEGNTLSTETDPRENPGPAPLAPRHRSTWAARWTTSWRPVGRSRTRSSMGSRSRTRGMDREM